MKRILLGIIAVVAMAVSATAQGVVFKEDSLSRMLSIAKDQNKYLFVDIYTTWCSPCRYMSNVVFPQKKAGDYFNQKFVNTKFNAEKGEGISVARQYKIQAYPTFLILNWDGQELGRIVGGGDIDDFIKEVEKVLKNIENRR